MFYVHNLNPIAFAWGSFVVPWYWLVYVVGFFVVYGLSSRLIRSGLSDLSQNNLVDFMVVSWLGLLIGGRFFYIIAYNLSFFIENPGEIFKIWKGGMSFHGGLLGVMLTGLWFSRWRQVSFLKLMDLMATTTPLVLGFGRLANFVNGELAGRPSQVPWAVVFPKYYDQLPRHPSQLYQAATEGFLLFIVLWLSRANLTKTGVQSVNFLWGYGLLRFLMEFFRTPDQQLGFYGTYFTLGQIFCVLMMGVGTVIHYRHRIGLLMRKP